MPNLLRNIMLILARIPIILFYVFLYFKKITIMNIKYLLFIKSLDNKLIDFLAILYSLESAGIHIDKLLRDLGLGKILLGDAYKRLGEQYIVFESATGSMVSALRQLSKAIYRSRLSKILNEYIDVFISSGDTRGYIKSALDTEISLLKDKLNNNFILIDNIYESYLIILLSSILLVFIPGISKYIVLLPLFIGISGIIAYIIASIIVENLYLNESVYLFILTIFLLILLAFLSFIQNIIYYIIVLVLIAIVSILANIYYKNYKMIDDVAVMLLEDLYTEATKGFTIEAGISRLSSRSRYSVILEPINRLMDIGLELKDAVSFHRFPPLASMIMKSIVIPLRYTGEHARYLASIMTSVHSILWARRAVLERTRIYIGYAFTLPIVSYIVMYGFLDMFPGSRGSGLLVNTILLASISAALVAGRLRRGCGLCDIKIVLAMALLNVLLYFIPLLLRGALGVPRA